MPEPGPYAAWLDRDVLEAAGEESATFLQGQISQDVSSLGDGASAWTWVLSPQGKVDALARVTRLSPQRWLLDTDSGWGEAVVARLNRFKLRTKVTIESRGWKVLGLRGPGAEQAGPASGVPGGDISGNLVSADPCWPGVVGSDLLGENPVPPAGWPVMGPQDYEAERIRVGFPKMGAELDERTIPGETGLVQRTVSFTKGCYTGQELVARVDSRGGNVPRRLARFSAQTKLTAGSSLIGSSGRPAGLLTSVAGTPDGGSIALGYLRRGVEVDEHLVTETERVAVAVEGLVG